jgi:hypothetical protein
LIGLSFAGELASKNQTVPSAATDMSSATKFILAVRSAAKPCQTPYVVSTSANGLPLFGSLLQYGSSDFGGATATLSLVELPENISIMGNDACCALAGLQRAFQI